MRTLLALAVTAFFIVEPSRALAQDPTNVPLVRPQDGSEKFRSLPERVQLDTLVVWTDIHGNAGDAFVRAKQVLDSLKVPFTVVDSSLGMIAHKGFNPRGGRLAGQANSTSMLCGFGPSGQYADVWRVTIAYVVYVRPNDEGGTKVGVGMLAQAKDIHGTSNSVLLCTSTGNFERTVANLVRKGLLR